MNFETSRLDRHIKRMYGRDIPQSLIEKSIRNGDILVNGKKPKSSDKVSDNDEVFVHPAICRLFADIYGTKSNKKEVDYSAYKDKFKDMIIFENNDLIIINKPAGLAVQLGSKTTIAVDGMAKAYNPEARLVHRIDKETSGITILAKNIEMSRYMLHLFQGKKVFKKYAAIVEGVLPPVDGVISKPLSRDKERTFVDFSDGKEAVTEFRVLKNMGKNRTLIEAIPKTGRTHQIRVHMASIDCPIVGDKKYNGPKGRFLFLHALEVSFIGRNRKNIRVKAELPGYFE